MSAVEKKIDEILRKAYDAGPYHNRYRLIDFIIMQLNIKESSKSRKKTKRYTPVVSVKRDFSRRGLRLGLFTPYDEYRQKVRSIATHLAKYEVSEQTSASDASPGVIDSKSLETAIVTNRIVDQLERKIALFMRKDAPREGDSIAIKMFLSQTVKPIIENNRGVMPTVENLSTVNRASYRLLDLDTRANAIRQGGLRSAFTVKRKEDDERAAEH